MEVGGAPEEHALLHFAVCAINLYFIACASVINKFMGAQGKCLIIAMPLQPH